MSSQSRSAWDDWGKYDGKSSRLGGGLRQSYKSGRSPPPMSTLEIEEMSDENTISCVEEDGFKMTSDGETLDQCPS